MMANCLMIDAFAVVVPFLNKLNPSLAALNEMLLPLQGDVHGAHVATQLLVSRRS